MASLKKLTCTAIRLASTNLFKQGTSNHFRSFSKSSPARGVELGEMHKPTEFQKKKLVWSGSYKSMEEIPERVSSGQLKRAQDLFRIRVNIIMVIMGVLAAIVTIRSGRKLREAGDSLEKRGTLQIEQWRLQGKQERAEKAASAASSE